MEINLRNYAHLGDAVWELFVRENIIEQCQNPKDLHKQTTTKVNCSYQASMLSKIESELTEEEEDLKRRARNMPVPIARRNNQSEYRQATAFEALIGYWYKEDKQRLAYIFEKLLSEIKN
ncbi:MAG: ribonuclease III domain-containing protein [Candidatus Gastranaerophilaceae bacterium]